MNIVISPGCHRSRSRCFGVTLGLTLVLGSCAAPETAISPVASTAATATTATTVATTAASEPPSANALAVLKYVDPFIATGGHGHAFPGAVVPFGMVQLSPDNPSQGWDWTSGYHYSDNVLIGFSHTHLSGTGVGDLLDILLMPLQGDYAQQQKNEHKRPFALYEHADEQASPGFYQLNLPGLGVKAELSATERVGVHRYSYSNSEKAKLLLDLGYAQNYDKSVVTLLKVEDAYTISGYRISTGWAKYQPLYFVATFNQPFAAQLYQDGKAVKGQLLQTEKGQAVLDFGALPGQSLVGKVALSYVSIDGAKANLAAEVPHFSFDRVKAEAAQRWATQLGRFQVNDPDETAKTKFYTALYHSYLAPQLFSDVDGRYFGADGAVHQPMVDGNQQQIPRYTLFSLWDTFRALHPLLTITDPSRVDPMMHSLLGFYDESGLLPTWDLMSNETDVMIGYHAVPVLADAYLKGLTTASAGRILQAAKASTQQSRFGIDLFGKYGYVPSDLDVEAVSKTLEYAFDDYAISKIAEAAGQQADADYFAKRALSYQQLFDASTGFFRGKTSNGAWVSPFNPIYVAHRTTDYTEANAWQYTFFVPHDVPGLMALYGGEAKFTEKLDTLFSMSSKMEGEVSPDITGLIGQYAHGNEPVHHVPYLYAFTGKKWQGEARIKQIRDSMYRAEPNGLAGNDDLGQMSAWYVFSALGFYPLNPVGGEFVLGTPQFSAVTLKLDHGKLLQITAEPAAPGEYVTAVSWNGQRIVGQVLNYQQLMQGGTLHFEFGPI
ncbi:GH92 family glycosyl hydrolase [Rheinheimera riviphila]|uniref:GH92 family glycosyl hydrolase n=1 Tax=Rheinheimera riviphila TaxID=1834037 RepID=UPI00198189AB|nr:GH92 family glycosyl hydrolase [Rheinheimera riviphila]